MKKALLLLAALTYAGFGSAQNVAADTVPALPPYIYCEIMADHLPTYRDSGVLFDFGQKVGATKYNYLTDAAGNKLLFSSGIEALNYMVCRGWEFVQAYASGDNNGLTHYPPRRNGRNRSPTKSDNAKESSLRSSFSFARRFAFPAYLSYIGRVKP